MLRSQLRRNGGEAMYCRWTGLLTLGALAAPLWAQTPDTAADSGAAAEPATPSEASTCAAWYTPGAPKSALDESGCWTWAEEGTSADVVAHFRASELVSPKDLVAVKIAVDLDAEFLATEGVTADFLLASVEHRMMTKGFSSAMAPSIPPDPSSPAGAAWLSPEQDETLWQLQLLDEYQPLRERVPALKAVDMLWASIAVEQDRRAIALLHVDAYEYLLQMVDYRIAHKVMVDEAVDAIVAACVDPDADLCQATYESETCEIPYAACRLSLRSEDFCASLREDACVGRTASAAAAPTAQSAPLAP